MEFSLKRKKHDPYESPSKLQRTEEQQDQREEPIEYKRVVKEETDNNATLDSFSGRRSLPNEPGQYSRSPSYVPSPPPRDSADTRDTRPAELTQEQSNDGQRQDSSDTPKGSPRRRESYRRSESGWDDAISPPATEDEGGPPSQPRKVVPFDRFIILNVEATCDFNPTNRAAVQVTKENAEIIEVAFAVMDVDSGQVVDKQRILVKPERTPVTKFCTEITGITAKELEDAGDLWSAVQHLDSYIQEEMVSKNLRYCLVTHGGWVLRIQLAREARDKELVLPDTLINCRMFDVKQELQRWQTYYQPDVTLPNTSLQELVDAFHLELVLTEESNGLNACLTLASIIRYLTSFGYSNVFVRPIDLGEDMMEFRKQESRVVHLAGLPHELTQGELEAWFSSNGLRLATAYMIRPFETSKPSLSGFAFFPTHEDALKALALNGKQMGDRVVAISPSSERVLDAAHYMVCAFPVQANGRTRRIGDWGCPNCGFINFATRRSCLKCNLGNPNGLQSMEEWVCSNPSCGFSNFATRDRCHQCKMSRTGQQPPPPTSVEASSSRPGDWICPNQTCNIHNYATRPTCRHCHTPKPPSSFSMSPTTNATTTPTLHHPPTHYSHQTTRQFAEHY